MSYPAQVEGLINMDKLINSYHNVVDIGLYLVINNKKRTRQILDFAVPEDNRVNNKENKMKKNKKKKKTMRTHTLPEN